MILGNPPFAALTTSSNPWIDTLLRAPILHERVVGSFYEVDGAPLAERKLWLHDDYIKFLRLAQWQIERAGCGVVGVVTNHGYLDNLTFRGVRQSLQRTFPRMSVLDLHGNHKKRETAAHAADENVFGIAPGVAVSLLRRPLVELPSQVLRADVWGSREEKLKRLAQGNGAVAWEPVAPQPPLYRFAPAAVNGGSDDEYARGFPLEEVMPVHSTAAVTARDGFAIAFTPDELLQRLRDLADVRYSDEELRRRFFNRTRSRRYPAGDTRSWKLPAAREQVRRVEDPRSLIRRCAYRPFDWRWIVWADWLIDWPRNEVMRHLLAGDNLALVTRRQMIPHHPATYFFVADAPVLDGLIRSDNRGSESFFPLYLGPPAPGGNRLANFSQDFHQACDQVAPPDRSWQPDELFAMIYAQVHAPAYRARFQNRFCHAFPRLFVPATRRLFETFVEHGRRLIDLHRLQPGTVAGWSGEPNAFPDDPVDSRDRVPGETIWQVPSRRYPRYAGGRLEVAENVWLESVPEAVWEFHVGGYRVCQKWLRDRAGRTLTLEEQDQYRRLVAAVRETVQRMESMDRAITAAGGWLAAFRGRC